MWAILSISINLSPTLLEEFLKKTPQKLHSSCEISISFNFVCIYVRKFYGYRILNDKNGKDSIMKGNNVLHFAGSDGIDGIDVTLTKC